MNTKEIYDFRTGKFYLSEDTDVARCFEIPNLEHLSLKKLKVLWEAGFGILGISKENDTYILYYFTTNAYAIPISNGVYKFWSSVICQLQDKPYLKSAFTETAVSINPYLTATLYQRPICCISAEKKRNISDEENARLNKINTDELEKTLNDYGYLPIRLQGMFYEQKETGDKDPNPQEISFLVVGRKEESDENFIHNMYGLGIKYNQNSILLREKNTKNAYYLGTSNVVKKETTAPGLGKKRSVGELLPYKLSEYCSIPWHYVKKDDGTIEKELNTNDSFSYGITKTKYPPFKSPIWNRIDQNMYQCKWRGKIFYKWIVTKDGIVYGNVELTRLAADVKISQVKRGNIPSKCHKTKKFSSMFDFC